MSRMKKALVLVVTLAATISIFLTGCGSDSVSTVTSTSPVTTLPASTSLTPNSPVSTTSAPLTSTAPAQPVSTTKATTPAATTVQPNNLTAQEIALKSVTATEKLKTLKFDMNFAMAFGMGLSGQTQTMNMQYTGTSSVNIPNKEMAMNMDMVMDVPQEGKKNMSAEIYSVGGYFYMKQNVTGQAAQWTKMKLTDEMWVQQSQLSSMTDFMKSPIGVELVGSENIKGVDCYILKITPDTNSLSEWMAGQSQGGVDLNSLGMAQMFDKFSVKAWVAKDSYLIAQQQIVMKFGSPSATTSTTPSILDQMSMDMNMLLTFYDYGKPVTIQLPPEALNAMEITTPPTR